MLSKFFDYKAGVTTTKTKRITHSYQGVNLFNPTSHVIEGTLRVGLLVVDRWGDLTSMYAHSRSGELHRSAADSRWPIIDFIELIFSYLA